MWDSNYMTFEIESIVHKKRSIQIWWLSNTTHAFNTLKVDSVSYWISGLFSNGNGSGSDANFIFDKPCLLPNRMHTESVLQTNFEPTLFTFPDWIIHSDFLIVCFEFNILFEIQIAQTPKTNILAVKIEEKVTKTAEIWSLTTNQSQSLLIFSAAFGSATKNAN